MLSRVADSLYWLAQNMERSENMTKLLSVRLLRTIENSDPKLGNEYDWSDILEITSNRVQYFQDFDKIDRQNIIEFIAFSNHNPNSIISCISVARENAKNIREVIPLELWEVINDLYLSIKVYDIRAVSTEQLNNFFQMILEKSLLFQGIINSLMPRGEGYIFIKIGKYLERARTLARILDVYYHKKLIERNNKHDINYHHWSAVLSSVYCYDSYLQKYQAFIDPKTVVNYLLFDDLVPHSAKYNIQKLRNSFLQLEGNVIHSYSEDLNHKLTVLNDRVNYVSIDEINEPLHDYFQSLQLLCNEVGVAITETYYLGEIQSL